MRKEGNIIYLNKPKRRIRNAKVWPATHVTKKPIKPVKFQRAEQVTKKVSPWFGTTYVLTHKRIRRNGVPMIKYLLTDLRWYVESELESVAEYQNRDGDD